jgi:aspartate/methionine/tyrosine aminotransferase
LALYAMEEAAELDARVDVYRANRDLMMDALPAMGLGKFAPPDGAFYVYVDVSEYTDDSLGFCRDVLDRAGVSITPGLDFDPVEGHHWVRLSYARSGDDMREGLARLSKFMDELRSAA